jgi:chloramphenicol O-acetyltransferase type A
MKQKLDLSTWNRQDHFHFFRQFDEPFFGATVQVDVTNAYQTAKELNTSFFLYYLHQSLVAANAVENFRYRIENDDEVWVHESISASPTIGRPDGTFGFAYMNYYPDYQTFATKANEEIQRIQTTKGLAFAGASDAVIHYSSLPWLDFTAISHARNFKYKDSCPKISFGKMVEENGKKRMAVSIHVHHALCDGFHVSQFVDIFQNGLNYQKKA